MKLSYLISIVALSTLGQGNPILAVEKRADPNPACWASLSCSFPEIEASDLQSRLQYVRYMQSSRFGPLKAGNKFRSVEAVIDWFISQNEGKKGSWVSYVDAGIVEGIQRGAAIALGKSTATGDNPGSQLWATYFKKLKAGQLENRDDHDLAWSQAEQAATDWGKGKAEKAGRNPTAQQSRWYGFTQIYRQIMRHRSPVIIAIRVIFTPINLPLAFAAEELIDWITDVTNFKAAHAGLVISWNLSEIDLLNGNAFWENAKLLLALIPKLWDEFNKAR